MSLILDTYFCILNVSFQVNVQKIPIIQTMCHQFLSLEKNAGKKKEDSFNWFEQFTQRQAKRPDSGDRSNPEIIDDISKEDKSSMQTIQTMKILRR